MDKNIEDALKDTDLSAVAADIQGEQNGEDEAVHDEKQAKGLAQFKDADALLKGYKELQGFSTRLSQENKKLKEEFEQFRAQLAEQGQQRTYTAPQAPQVDYENLVENPGQTISDIVAAHSVTEALQDLEEDDPRTFNERYQFASLVSRNPQYAALAKSGRGVKKLFQLGDKLREQQLRQNANKSLEFILGEPVDDEAIQNLRGILKSGKKKKQNTTDAYMPDSTTSSLRPGTGPEQTRDFDRLASEAANEGDMDRAIQAAFGKALSK